MKKVKKIEKIKKYFMMFIMAICIFVPVVYANTPTIQFATEATYPPFVYVNPKGEIVGFDAEIVQALCHEMHATCILHNQSWASLIPSLQLGKYDALFGGLAITPLRQKQVAFTKPYYLLTGSLIAKKDIALAAIKTAGVQTSSTYDTYLQDTHGKTWAINRYASVSDALMDLTADRIDAVMGDTPVMEQWVKNQPAYTIVGSSIRDEKYLGQGDAIAVRLNNSTLLNQLNAALAAIKGNGTYCQIVRKHFGSTYPCSG